MWNRGAAPKYGPHAIWTVADQTVPTNEEGAGPTGVVPGSFIAGNDKSMETHGGDPSWPRGSTGPQPLVPPDKAGENG